MIGTMIGNPVVAANRRRRHLHLTIQRVHPMSLATTEAAGLGQADIVLGQRDILSQGVTPDKGATRNQAATHPVS